MAKTWILNTQVQNKILIVYLTNKSVKKSNYLFDKGKSNLEQIAQPNLASYFFSITFFMIPGIRGPRFALIIRWSTFDLESAFFRLFSHFSLFCAYASFSLET